MKVIPYTSVSTAIPAMCLVAVNSTVMLGPTVQMAALTLVLVACARSLTISDSINARVLVAYVTACVFVGFLNYGASMGVMRGGKLVLIGVLSLLVIRKGGFSHFSALVALRAFFVLCTVNLLYAIAIGGEVFRGNYFIEYSINSSYTIAILVYMARPRLKLYDRILAWGFVVQCGSTTGMFVLILADLVGRKFSPKMLIGSAVMIPFAMFALIQLMLARGKEVSLDYLINSDRGVLLSTFYRTVIPDFQLWNWFTGLGVGYPMHQYITHDSSFTAYLMRLGDGTIYSFCLHIEAIRLLSDFGIIGIFLVGMQLWRNCSIPLLILLFVCMMTNTHIYNFSGALLASTIFNGGRARSRAPQKLNEPVYA